MYTNWRNMLFSTAEYLLVVLAALIPTTTAGTNIGFILIPILVLVSGRGTRILELFGQSTFTMLCVLFCFMWLGATVYSHASCHMAFHYALKYNKFLLGIFFLPLVKERKWVLRCLDVFGLTMAAVALISIVYCILHPNFSPVQSSHLFRNYIATGLCMALASFWLLCRPNASQGRSQQLSKHLLLLMMLGFLFFINPGRSGVIVFVLLTLYWVVTRQQLKSAIYGTCLLGILIGLTITFHAPVVSRLANLNYLEKITTFWGFPSKNPPEKRKHNASVRERFDFAINTGKLVLSHPLMGYGPGSLPLVYKAQFANKPNQHVIVTTNPHNEYLNTSVALGLPGLFIMLLLFLSGWQTTQNLPAGIKVFARGLYVAYGFGCAINSWFMDTTPGHLFVYFAMVFAGLHLAIKEQTVNEKECIQEPELTLLDS